MKLNVTILGPLVGEPPEPMTRSEFDAARKRIRDSWNGSVTFSKRDAEQLVAEIAWLKRRLECGDALEPPAESLRPNS